MPAQSDRVCSVDACDRPHYGRGYWKHISEAGRIIADRAEA